MASPALSPFTHASHVSVPRPVRYPEERTPNACPSPEKPMTSDTPTRIGIVTGEEAPTLTADGRALSWALAQRGAATAALRWDDSSVDWATFDVALVRSCWSYYERLDAFQEWLSTVEDAGVTLLNPGDVVRWNVHKSYLRDLEAAGVPVLPTAWVERGTDASLPEILARHGWDEAVVKPAVGTSSDGVWRTSDAADAAARFDDQLAATDLLVQAFAPEIGDGELSLVCFQGEYSHAYRVVPADGDFRAHPNFGGTLTAYDPPEHVRERATGIVQAACDCVGVDPVELPYARVDGVIRDGEFRLVELELVEPYLNLDSADGAAAAFADAVEAAIDHRRLTPAND
jgi:glutathione synthase/RimK-type ligase-like ATP-grasp enzyme